MEITRVSPVTGKENTRDLDVTQDQLDSWRSGTLIQRAMPNLSADDREFIMSGLTPEDWAAMFAGTEDD